MTPHQLHQRWLHQRDLLCAAKDRIGQLEAALRRGRDAYHRLYGPEVGNEIMTADLELLAQLQAYKVRIERAIKNL